VLSSAPGARNAATPRGNDAKGKARRPGYERSGKRPKGK
jgi:hypothetical protein